MAGIDVEEVAVFSFGQIFLADKDTEIPSDLDDAITAMADDTTWHDLGYIDENGISSLTFGKTEQDIFAWQTQDPIRKIISARNVTMAAALMQLNSDTLPFALGGGAWTPGSGNEFVFEFPLASDPTDERALLLNCEDGDTQMVLAFYRAIVTGDATSAFNRTNAAKLNVTLSFLSGTPGNVGRIVGTQDLSS